jgi:pimeloyl-ACP methyl ester carboxylesterase
MAVSGGVGGIMRRAIRTFFKWTVGILAALLAGIIVFCFIPIKPTVAPLKPRQDTRYWAMSKGYRIAYTRISPATVVGLPPIIFLHGGPGGYVHSSTISVLGDLSELGYEVYFYDQAGCGLSDRLAKPKDYSFPGHVEDLREIITDHIGGGQVILIGHSYGGQLAAQLTAMHSELVVKLVLSSPGELQPSTWENGVWVKLAKYPAPDSLEFKPVERAKMDGIRFWTVRGSAAMALAMFNIKFMPDAEADGLLNTLASRFTANMVCDIAHVLPEEGGAGFYAHGWSNFYGDLEDPRPLMQACPVPVLVLQGQCDYIPYSATYEYVALFPDSRYEFIKEAGHIIWWDQPGDYFCHIVDFLHE